MIVKNLSISEIRMIEFDPKTKSFTLDIYTSEGSMQKGYKLVLINALPDQILNDIKKEKFPSDDEDDDILPGIKLINIRDDEEIKEALLKSFLRLGQRVLDSYRLTEASDYMKSYKALSTSQEVIYKK